MSGLPGTKKAVKEGDKLSKSDYLHKLTLYAYGLSLVQKLPQPGFVDDQERLLRSA